MPDIVLFQFAGGDGQDSWSSFCTKVHRVLNLKGLTYRPQVVANPSALKRINPGVGKVPVLRYDDEHIPDSSRIARVLDERHPDPPLWPTEPRDRALVHALEDWADESLYWYVVYYRWQVDEYFEPFARRAFRFVPAPMRPLVKRVARRQSTKMLHGQGLGRLDRATIREQVGAHLQAISDFLGDREWLVGDAPTLADIALFAVVQGLHSTGLPEPRDLVDEYDRVVAWAKRVDERTSGAHTASWE